MTTNGILLNRKLVEALTELYFANILVSVPSIREETYQKIVGVKNVLENVLENVLLMKKLGNNVIINIVLSKDNIDEFDETKQFFIERGFESFQVSCNPVNPRVNGDFVVSRFRPSKEKLYEHYSKNPTYNFNKFGKGGRSLTCVSGHSLLAIDYKGFVHPCTILEFPVGNIRQESIKRIWKNSPTMKLLRMIDDSIFKQCEKCYAKDYCEICIAQNYSVTGNFYKSNRFTCELGKIWADIHGVSK